MNAHEAHRERVSALVDGDWRGSAGQEKLRMLSSEEAKAAWLIYHQIGDVLRGPEHAAFLNDRFNRRFRARFAAEPVFLPVQSRRRADLPALSTPARETTTWNTGGLALYWKQAGGVIGTALIAATAAFFFSATSQRSTMALEDSQAIRTSEVYEAVGERSKTPILLDTPAAAAKIKPIGIDASTGAADKAVPNRQANGPALTPVSHAGTASSHGGLPANRK